MIAFGQGAAGAARDGYHMVRAPGSISRVAETLVYLPALDGLRAVSILLVVLSHLGADRLVPGAFGVTLFFFISGFLITRQLRGALLTNGRIGFASFYLRRALRLMPAALAFVGLAGLGYVVAGGTITTVGWVAALFYGANYYDLWVGYHSTLAGVRHPFNILWSLAIEEHFYLIWPAMLAVLWRGRWALTAALLLCVAVLCWRLWLWNACFVPGAPLVCGPENHNPVWRYNRLYLATDARLDSIAWGAILALAPMRASAGQAAAGVACLLAGFFVPGAFARHVLRPSLQGVALLGVVPWLLSGETVVHRALRVGPVRLVGRLSYSLYLWHWAALAVADGVCRAGGVAWVVVAVGLSGGLAAASYWGIERPMLGVRRRFGSAAWP
jgi:peptidoglycan/LPS O-acetylase OafA/YrhL